jgi:hypothetical protein
MALLAIVQGAILCCVAACCSLAGVAFGVQFFGASAVHSIFRVAADAPTMTRSARCDGFSGRKIGAASLLGAMRGLAGDLAGELAGGQAVLHDKLRGPCTQRLLSYAVAAGVELVLPPVSSAQITGDPETWVMAGDGGGGRGSFSSDEALEIVSPFLAAGATAPASHSTALAAVGQAVHEGSVTSRECYVQALLADAEYAPAWFRLSAVGGGTVGGARYTAEQCFQRGRDATLAWAANYAPPSDSNVRGA